MKLLKFSEGTGRTAVQLSTDWIGGDLIVRLSNEKGHIGAVAVADYDSGANRASTSVITRLGHKDDQVAYNTAYRICSRLQKPVCAIAGIHVDNISKEEIAQIMCNCEALVERCIEELSLH